MIGSRMIAIGAGWQHGHSGRHGGDGAFVIDSFGTMQRRTLRSLTADNAATSRNGGNFPRVAAIAAMIAAVIIIAAIASIPSGRPSLGRFVRTAAFLIIGRKVFIVLHPSDDLFAVWQRFGTASLLAFGIGRRRRAANVDARNAGIDAGTSRVDGMHRQSRLGPASHHVTDDVVSRRRRTSLRRTESGYISRRRIDVHVKGRIIASLIFKVGHVLLLLMLLLISRVRMRISRIGRIGAEMEA